MKKTAFLWIGCLLAILLVAWVTRTPYQNIVVVTGAPQLEGFEGMGIQIDPATTGTILKALVKGVKDGVVISKKEHIMANLLPKE